MELERKRACRPLHAMPNSHACRAFVHIHTQISTAYIQGNGLNRYKYKSMYSRACACVILNKFQLRQACCQHPPHVKPRKHFVCLSVCLSVCLYVCLDVRLSSQIYCQHSRHAKPRKHFAYLPACLSVCLSFCLSVFLSVCLNISNYSTYTLYRTVYLSVCLSCCLSVLS